MSFESEQPYSDAGGSNARAPKTPEHIDSIAAAVLQELAKSPEAGEVVLGGYFALRHYLDYRQTHDIDAWWRSEVVPSAEAEKHIRRVMHEVAVAVGDELRERRFGETWSLELRRGGRKYFSFQISRRSIALDPPLTSGWPPVMIESLRDNLASKMTALVDRGSPRDFRDIEAVAKSGLATVAECLDLWSRKHPGEAIESAMQKIILRLEEIEARRPLESIADGAERLSAGERRGLVSAPVRWRQSLMYIDHSVYPDLDDPPDDLVSIYDKADYVHRICSAWDFEIHPEPDTFALFANWKDVFDRFPMPMSPGYRAFRTWFGWEPVPMPPGLVGPEPHYVGRDRLEERGPDPCENLI